MDIEVVVAIFCDRAEAPGRIYGTEKGYGPYKGFWEFPGGKVEPGEGPEEALRREIREELSVEIEILGLFQAAVHDYPEYRVHLALYWARPLGEIKLLEASAGRWMNREEVDQVTWLEGTRPVIDRLKKVMAPPADLGGSESPHQKP